MDDSNDMRFPIRELVRRTGVNASTLRAWENRHGLLNPLRTPSGHRLYTQNDVQRIRRLQELLVQGLNLSELVPLLDADAPPATPATGPAAPAAAPAGPAWRRYLQDLLRALEDFSTERLDNLYNEACSLYPIDLVTENLLMPALEELGARWARRATGIAEEHFFTAWLRNKLGARMHHVAGMTRGRPLILACLPGETHEIGLLLFALGALQRGHRVIYLGANMPIRQLAHVAEKTLAAGVVLTGRAGVDAPAVLPELAWLAQAGNAPVFLGSRFAVEHRDDLDRIGVLPLGEHLGQGLARVDKALASQRASRGRRPHPPGQAPA